jgi:hypothetical protein
MTRPLVPRDWQTTNAIAEAGRKRPLVIRLKRSSKRGSVFNGSQNNKNNNKRPITLPNIDK